MVVLGLGLLISACGGGAQGTGHVTTNLTDAPTDEYSKVLVTISEVEAHISGDVDIEDDEDDGDDDDGDDDDGGEVDGEDGWVELADDTREYDLLALQGDATEVMGDEGLPAGKYTQIRLIVDSAKTVDTNGYHDVRRVAGRHGAGGRRDRDYRHLSDQQLLSGHPARSEGRQLPGHRRHPHAHEGQSGGQRAERGVGPAADLRLGPDPGDGRLGGGGMLIVAVLFIRRVGWHVKLRRATARKIMQLGVPMGVNQALSVAGFAVFTALLARMGEAELAAHRIAIKIISVSFLPGYGISEATSILTGQYAGVGRVDAARRAFRSAVVLGGVLMGACGLVFLTWPTTLVRVFNTHPEVVRIGARLMWVAAVFQVFDAVAMVATGALNGSGDTVFTMWMSMVSKWLVLVPSAYLFGYVFEWGATGAWMGLTVEILVYAVVALARFSGNRWGRKTVVGN